MERTLKKLREAEFFYSAMNAEAARIMKPDPEAIEFYLSAFVTAARTVTLALQKEHKAQYDEWFPNWWATALTDSERERMDFIKAQRNSALKEGAMETATAVEEVPLWKLQHELGLKGGSLQVWGIPGFPPPNTTARTVLEFEGAIVGNVVEVCGAQLGVLRRLVAEFQQYAAA